MTTQPEATRSDLLAAVHEAASSLHEAGVMEEPALRRPDVLCLTPAEALDRLSQATRLGGLSLRELIGRDRS